MVDGWLVIQCVHPNCSAIPSLNFLCWVFIFHTKFISEFVALIVVGSDETFLYPGTVQQSVMVVPVAM